MKPFLISASLILLLVLFASCGNSRRSDPVKQEETPKALEEKKFSNVITSSRGEDLVQSLYTELVDKSPELQKLEKELNELSESESDSLHSFMNYNSKNESYYRSTRFYADQITDSLLRKKINALINTSKTSYKALSFRDSALLQSIDSKNITLKDLHTILKISKTLPMIETYQKNELPSSKPMEGYLKQVDKVIDQVDSLSKN